MAEIRLSTSAFFISVFWGALLPSQRGFSKMLFVYLTKIAGIVKAARRRDLGKLKACVCYHSVGYFQSVAVDILYSAQTGDGFEYAAKIVFAHIAGVRKHINGEFALIVVAYHSYSGLYHLVIAEDSVA